MTLEPDTSPVAISCTIARYDDGEPALDLYGRPTFILRAAHLDTGAVLTAEIPAGSAEALDAIYDMGAQVEDMIAHALASLNGGEA